MSDIAWEAYEALGVEPDLDAVGFHARPVTVDELERIRLSIEEAVGPGPLRFTSYIGPDGQRVHGDGTDAPLLPGFVEDRRSFDDQVAAYGGHPVVRQWADAA